MDLPLEILFMIVEAAATPLDDITPLDQKSLSAPKSLSMANKAFRQICLAATLHHIRMWKKEANLADHLRRIYLEGSDILPFATSLSIRSIGPVQEIPAGARRHAAQQMPDFIENLSLVMSVMPCLSEIRFVADNGKYTMEPVWRKLFNPRFRRFPTVKSLYLRTASSMASIFKCFPNLEALNFNLHGNMSQAPGKTLSPELKVLKQGDLSIRSLAILKTAQAGWNEEDIKFILGLFPRVQRLFLQGCICSSLHGDRLGPHTPSDFQNLANLFKRHRNLRHLALTDEIYWVAHKSYSMHYKVALSDPSKRWKTMATAMFNTLPNLDELCLARQVDFKGRVFRRGAPRPNPAPPTIPATCTQTGRAIAIAVATSVAESNANPGPQDHDREKPIVLRTYVDKRNPDYALAFPYDPSPRLIFPPARWTGTRCVWWPINGQVPVEPDQFGEPDEPAGFVSFTSAAPELAVGRGGAAAGGGGQRDQPAWINYQQMIKDHCETGVWDVEWLRVVRPRARAESHLRED
ncbi:hypothetical protein N657DRAFT_679431 [Parathielavia appendiculata]|uniref:Uncharacterized protein n=1 Tax=Parathielavia appendiculata TaxID=2587402 RepID=A0AAN6U4V9_9PEZI|nr:hypothetical protein N657DRAFT_679431 [Parathielavia appendiculata]